MVVGGVVVGGVVGRWEELVYENGVCSGIEL